MNKRLRKEYIARGKPSRALPIGLPIALAAEIYSSFGAGLELRSPVALNIQGRLLRGGQDALPIAACSSPCIARLTRPYAAIALCSNPPSAAPSVRAYALTSWPRHFPAMAPSGPAGYITAMRHGTKWSAHCSQWRCSSKEQLRRMSEQAVRRYGGEQGAIGSASRPPRSRRHCR